MSFAYKSVLMVGFCLISIPSFAIEYNLAKDAAYCLGTLNASGLKGGMVSEMQTLYKLRILQRLEEDSSFFIISKRMQKDGYEDFRWCKREKKKRCPSSNLDCLISVHNDFSKCKRLSICVP